VALNAGRHTLSDPSAAFAEPFIGPVAAAENVGDAYVPFSLRWLPASGVIHLFIRGPSTLVELGFDERTHRLSGVTLVMLPPEFWLAVSPPPAEVPVVEGLPRCEPATWLARTRTGSFNDHADRHLHTTAPVRMSVSPGEAVLSIDGVAGEVVRELASGRARIGVDARGAIAYVRLAPLTAREAALLREQAGAPVA
jgi:hypothetical protein